MSSTVAVVVLAGSSRVDSAPLDNGVLFGAFRRRRQVSIVAP